MNEDSQQQILETLREIRDGQRELLALLNAQKELAEAQIKKSGQRFEESVELQRTAVRRAKVVTLIAVPGIIACIAAIAYLVFRFF